MYEKLVLLQIQESIRKTRRSISGHGLDRIPLNAMENCSRKQCRCALEELHEKKAKTSKLALEVGLTLC